MIKLAPDQMFQARPLEANSQLQVPPFAERLSRQSTIVERVAVQHQPQVMRIWCDLPAGKHVGAWTHVVVERVAVSSIRTGLHPVCRKPLNRRFIVVEGIYAGLGDLAPLDKICELKKKYKYR